MTMGAFSPESSWHVRLKFRPLVTTPSTEGTTSTITSTKQKKILIEIKNNLQITFASNKEHSTQDKHMYFVPLVVAVTAGLLNLVQLLEPMRMALISYSVSDSSPLMR